MRHHSQKTKSRISKNPSNNTAQVTYSEDVIRKRIDDGFLAFDSYKLEVIVVRCKGL